MGVIVCPFCGEAWSVEPQFCNCCGRHLPFVALVLLGSRGAHCHDGHGETDGGHTGERAGKDMVGMIAAVVLLAMTDWASVVKPASKQVPRLEILKDGSEQPGVCSGVVINKAAGYVLTAAHCVEGDPKSLSVTVNGRHAEIVRSNRLLDLAVVRTILKDEQQMELAPQTPEMGTEVAVLGFAFGIDKMAVQFGRVSQSLNSETASLWLNVDLIFGDSGGPAIDAQGRLIGINSRIYSTGPAHMAAVVPIEQIRDFVGHLLPLAK